ncbi:GFA family protein [Sinirhodobacter huangdaonensis]|uniref:GFA family protein n=1 Tax=Paenirhodobacter huangdaonensis TaxID=2501515 RepID=A0A3S3LYT9_9RHOB|nr:GFA family protein [Sinirhodobacter huangdaonensis]RWR51641.1 GFA family protein [Sinirhodobacter huangdaonensis]
MHPTPRDYPEARGGCQCGAVRFTISAGPADYGLCHCRMCQRATGNAFAPLFGVAADRITWQGAPREWASSSVAARGFCPTCGTPLYYRDAEEIEIMAGCFSPDFRPEPQFEAGIESRLGWLDDMIHRFRFATEPELVARVISYQAKED